MYQPLAMALLGAAQMIHQVDMPDALATASDRPGYVVMVPKHADGEHLVIALALSAKPEVGTTIVVTTPGGDVSGTVEPSNLTSVPPELLLPLPDGSIRRSEGGYETVTMQLHVGDAQPGPNTGIAVRPTVRVVR